jgi:ElaB/YqjD/DUF883 family membrane-anchored ribosome-binding protein
MREEKLGALRSDVQLLLQEAQALFAEAAAASGKKAEELRANGDAILNRAFAQAENCHSSMLQAGKEMVTSTDDYVQSNPWRSIAISSGIGLLLGLCISRSGGH